MTASTLKQKILLAAAPALLVAVALTQQYLARNAKLTSWLGGGFGMFATYPTETRRMSITLITADNAEFLIPPPQIEDRVRLQGRMPRLQKEILAHPSQRRMEELTRELVSSEWIAVRLGTGTSQRVIPGLSRDFLGNRAEAVPFPVAAVRIDVWKYEPDFRARKLLRSQLASVTSASGNGKDGHSR